MANLTARDILNLVYDGSGALRTNKSGTPTTNLTAQDIINLIYDSTNVRLKLNG